MTTDLSNSLEHQVIEFSLASAITSYPGAEVEAALRQLSPALEKFPWGIPFLTSIETQTGLEHLQSEFIDLFDRGDRRIALYETEYGRMRGMSKGKDLADINGFYKAFGLDFDSSDVHEMADHVSVELEFYTVLLAKQNYFANEQNQEASEIVLDARKKFLAEHLAPLAQGIAKKIADRDGNYTAVFQWVDALVRSECDALQVKAVPLDFYEDVEMSKEMQCADNVHLPVIQDPSVFSPQFPPQES